MKMVLLSTRRQKEVVAADEIRVFDVAGVRGEWQERRERKVLGIASTPHEKTDGIVRKSQVE